MDEKKFRDFAAMLEAPVLPNLRIERLLAAKAPW